jgi:HlyD family secretion protein
MVVGVTVALSRLKPAAPTVEKGTLWFGTVKRGEMLRNHRGLGTLVPEDIRWIPARTQGRVEERLIYPGTKVSAHDVIMILSNPELEQQVQDAELALKVTEAAFANLKVQLESELLNQRAGAAQVESAYRQALLAAETDEQLRKEGLTSELVAKRSALQASELKQRDEIEKKRLEIAAESVRARLASQQAQVDQSRALHELRKKQLDSLKVRAGFDGVLQLLAVEVGQQVAPGTNLARVANPTRLKAEIRIAETQAKDVQIGQKAEIDTRNGIVMGRVSRIDPAVQNGTVTVDVALEGTLPPGARPDLSVDGTVEIERLADVMYVERPVQGQPNSTVTLFKVVEDGGGAERVQVKLGRSSVNFIEVLAGLQVGEQVILSDMSAQDGRDRVRLR